MNYLCNGEVSHRSKDIAGSANVIGLQASSIR
jgi:hypothetical protein